MPIFTVKETIENLKSRSGRADRQGYDTVSMLTINSAIAYLETIKPHPYDEMTLEQLLDEARSRGLKVHLWNDGNSWKSSVWFPGRPAPSYPIQPTPTEALRHAMKEAMK